MAAVGNVCFGAHFVELLAVDAKVAIAVVAIGKGCGLGWIFGVDFIFNVVVATDDTEIWLGIEKDRLRIMVADIGGAGAVFGENGGIDWKTIENVVSKREAAG